MGWEINTIKLGIMRVRHVSGTKNR